MAKTALQVVEDMRERLLNLREDLQGEIPVDQVHADYQLAKEIDALLKNERFCAILGTIIMTREADQE